MEFLEVEYHAFVLVFIKIQANCNDKGMAKAQVKLSAWYHIILSCFFFTANPKAIINRRQKCISWMDKQVESPFS